jgi:hypothetical protein
MAEKYFFLNMDNFKTGWNTAERRFRVFQEAPRLESREE